MGDFIYKSKVFYNPVEFAIEQIGGTWKMPILWRIKDKPKRYSELKKDIPHISHKMLTSQLRELEEDGFLSREVFPVVPPRVEYSMTKKGIESLRIVEVIRNYGIDLMQEAGIEKTYKKTNDWGKK